MIRVLLVEDDAVDRMAVHRALRQGRQPHEQIEVEDAATIAMGLSRLETVPFDCALVDYRLPDGDAVGLLDELVARKSKRTPIIILTGHDDEATAIRALHGGAQDYLLKGSLDGNVLIRTIRYAIERFAIQGELEQARVQLERLAFLDPLTELLNRRGLEHALPAELSRISRSGAPLYAVLVDCDDFKQVNDRHGYTAGDAVLKEVSKRLRQTIRTTDHLARIGGDEFLILFPESRMHEAIHLADRVRNTIGQSPVEFDARTLEMTVSVGVFEVPAEARSITELLTQGQAVLRNSKRAGKDRVTAEVSVPLTSDEALQVPGDRDHIRAQPIHRLRDAKQVGCELRTGHHAGSAELASSQNDANIDLTAIDWTCFQRCAQAGSELSVEQCHLTLDWTTLLDTPLASLLGALPGNRSRYCITLGMQRMIGDPARYARKIADLRGSGIRVALDDVNFSRSSLEASIVLRPDVLKIDRNMFLGAVISGQQGQNVARIVRVAAALGMEVIASGIESEADWVSLLDLGVEFAQGFARCGPLEETAETASHGVFSS